MPESKRELTVFGKTVKMVVPLGLILCGAAAWYYFKATAPVMTTAQPRVQAALVETRTAVVENTRAVVPAMGTVTAAKEATLKAQVSAAVLSVSERFVPGSFVDKGETLLLLDPSDYQVAVQKAQSALETAEAALSIEQGSQNIAREELRVLAEISGNQVVQTDLALRKPQLAQAQAAVAGARADLAQAGLNLARTRITAPFNAMIVERFVHVGTYVGSQESLVTLVGTDEFWIEALIPLDNMSYIDGDYPGGCPVRVRSQSGAGVWEGRVIQVTGELSDTSRMALVIVAVKNPMGVRNHPSAQPLMIGDYVHADITGRVLSDVVVLPRAALNDNDTVWINAGNILEIRKVTLAWKDEEHVYIKTGIAQSEQVVVSELSTPVEGMALKTLDATNQDAGNAVEQSVNNAAGNGK